MSVSQRMLKCRPMFYSVAKT